LPKESAIPAHPAAEGLLLYLRLIEVKPVLTRTRLIVEPLSICVHMQAP